ncbi:DUF1129 domain-containing protein [Clostridium septicum]|uniref:DUF1129 family protein n=1 Tax=Clostridium septicum TaxID=1504 RepID=A0A9N7PKV9_CLOSE|nr:hypothetical protein [Clostridium septicum]AYE33212.1 hypothetical protein CP523_01425 [Clostridium septicum]MDU1314405.1 hypothetical protein [Clostridium septicum]QAS61384.1 hypothetical protein EI377_11945 [Clostridium septicum]UEC22185.1 hypothetical protein LK444_07455 [Clostridium septicum]USR99785.1 hypothetical protein NH397_09730 [Clostridium septicum]
MSNLYSMRNENIKISKNLTGENQKIFTDIVCYLRVSKLNEIEQEEVINDILTIFFDCEKDKKDIQSVIGNDFKKFTDEIISAVNPKTSIFNKIKEFLIILIQSLGIILTLDFIVFYLPKIINGNFALTYTFTLSMVIHFLILLIIAIFLINYVGKNSFKLSETKYSIFKRFIIGASTGAIFVLLIFLNKIFNDINLLSLNIGWILGIIIVFWCCMLTKRIKNRLLT